VERLLSGVMSQVSMIFPAPPPAKDLYLCVCDSIEELANAVEPTSSYFGLLLAIDPRGTATRDISEAATKLLARGLAYLCAWGPDCERVHDIFDEKDIARTLAGEGPRESVEDVVMTTWHADEPLEESLWFFVHSAFPADGYKDNCKDWIIATVGHPEWAQEVRGMISRVVSEPPPD
jgi:hypothetical protein